METNCYLVSSSSDGDPEGSSSEVERKSETLIIDPGDDADFITQTILENNLKPVAIVLTHGHFDHVLGCLELKLNFDVPIMLHKNDLKLYSSANQNALHWLKKRTLKVPPIDQYIKEGDEIKLGNEKLKVIETPGHTPGSISLYSAFPSPYLAAKRRPRVFSGQENPLREGEASAINPVIFTGDTLFANGVGRTDFSYSSPSDLQKSLNKISNLKSEMSNEQCEIFIYPGHGEPTIL